MRTDVGLGVRRVQGQQGAGRARRVAARRVVDGRLLKSKEKGDARAKGGYQMVERQGVDVRSSESLGLSLVSYYKKRRSESCCRAVGHIESSPDSRSSQSKFNRLNQMVSRAYGGHGRYRCNSILTIFYLIEISKCDNTLLKVLKVIYMNSIKI